MLKKHLLFLFLLFWFSQNSVLGQVIWPGDVNNNGVVNGVDLLYWGQAYGTTGPVRADSSAEWMAMSAAPNWVQSFPNGLNYSFADCNGDGVVDEEDFDDAIEENYGLTHGRISGDGFANAAVGSNAPALRLETATPIVGPNAMVDISLSIDDPNMALQGFYGMALSLKYNTAPLAGDDGLDFDLNENSWLNRDGSFVEDLFVDNKGGGEAMLAVSRTNQQPVMVQNEELGRFSVVIEDIVILKEIDTLRIEIDSVLIISDGFKVVPVQPTSIEIIVAKDPNSVITTNNESILGKAHLPRTKIYPNPAYKTFYIQSDIPIHQVEVYSVTGQMVDFYIQQNSPTLYYIQLSTNQPTGILWIRIRSDKLAITRKLLYQSD
jgi:hypothetical protein